jgi:hypothetical protein
VKKKSNINSHHHKELFDKKKTIVLMAEIVTHNNFLSLHQNLVTPLSSHEKKTEKLGK